MACILGSLYLSWVALSLGETGCQPEGQSGSRGEAHVEKNWVCQQPWESPRLKWPQLWLTGWAANSWEILSQKTAKLLGFLTHRSYEIINICCFKDNLLFSSRYWFPVSFSPSMLFAVWSRSFPMRAQYRSLPHCVDLGHLTCSAHGIWVKMTVLTSYVDSQMYCMLPLTFLDSSILCEEELVATCLGSWYSFSLGPKRHMWTEPLP